MADAPRYGRRRRGDEGESKLDSTRGGGDVADGGALVDRSSARMGWGMGAEAKAESSQGSKSLQPLSKASGSGKGAAAARTVDNDDDEEVMAIIPDLEEEAQDDIVTQVAEAPVNTTRRFQTLAELNDSIRFALPSSVDGLDLSVLTGYLPTLESVEERDEEWDFDKLLQAVGNEMQAELDAAAAASAEAASKRDGKASHEDDVPVVET